MTFLFFFDVRRPELPFTFFCPFTNERWEYLRINDGKKWGVCLASRSGVFLTQLDCHFTGFFFLGRLPLLPSWSFRSRYYLIIYLPSSDWFFLIPFFDFGSFLFFFQYFWLFTSSDWNTQEIVSLLATLLFFVDINAGGLFMLMKSIILKTLASWIGSRGRL